ncbi:alpha-L-rhamnosidase [Sphingobacterium puteale]|uniref:alpha-L-rhamnosidase n=1 Tax=Sphingobacterium puteale TaxID=2420510 RepID=A0A420W3X0_9SPHI|nr:family 78 glycoside hydrolase catalytic domain [Sphingobacterium puteale]RKO73299.1 alpha-L-rhamnosidase [Sphingobacterium puteale]
MKNIGKQGIVLGSIFLLLLAIPMVGMAKLAVTRVLIEGRENPLGTNTLTPAFSWQLSSDKSDVRQQAYRIEVSKSARFAKQDMLWDSQWVATEQSLNLLYQGTPLATGTSYYIRVQVRDNKKETATSAVQRFHTGLLNAEDWGNARWIAKDILPDSLINPLPLSSSKLRLDKSYELPVFRKSVHVKKKISSSIAYVAGLGHYELLLNGKRVDDAVLQPGWTKYDKEAYYVVYDLTQAWQQGKNTIAALLGNGFYYIPPIKGRFQKHKVAFGLPKLKLKIVNTFTDGTQEFIVSDAGWKTHRSPITFSSMYGGEDYNAQILPDHWSAPNYDDRSWQQAVITDGPHLRAQDIDPVKIMQRFAPVRFQQADGGKRITYDFGQNASGIVTMQMTGQAGDTVRVYPAELLTADGRPSQKHSGSPYYYQYIFAKDETVSWQPRFTYYGFRYAEVQLRSAGGKPIRIDAIQLAHIRNSTTQLGSFQSSDTLFNQIHKLINWAIKSNMVSVFTDCPHREKLGWLEQLHLMGPSVQFNFDAERLFAKSLRDMRQSQTKDGLVPEIAPEYVQFDWGGDMFRDSPEWGSSSIILAWYAYCWYGNKAFLTDNYAMMIRYIDYLGTKAKDHILTQGLGDWYDLGPERPGVSQLTTPGITATAIYYYDLKLMKEIATLLGKKEDANKFENLQQAVFDAFNQQFYRPQEHSYGSGSQTALAMPLYVGLVPQEAEQAVFNRLTKTVCQNDTALTAGDIGHRYLLQVLQANKRDDLIYAMHHRDDRPGYGYQLRKGATALTESWAGLPNVSNNHFMLGHLMEWFHTGLGGIQQDAGSTAFKHFRIEPKLLNALKDCEISFRSPYGKIYFNREQSKGNYQLEIPVNSQCTLILPKGSYLVNGKQLDRDAVVSTKEQVELKLGSGKYTITK